VGPVEKSNPDFSTVPTALGNPATDAGFPHFPSHDGGGYRLPLKTKPAKIAGPVRFLRRALKARIFDPKDFLAQTGLGRTIMQYPKNNVIFAQGEPSDAVFYIQKGRTIISLRSYPLKARKLRSHY
jgi:hypothetical protein